MGQTKAQRIIKQLAGKVQKQTPIASDMFLPNHSGDHSAGKTGTPVNDRDLVNKKYVDSEIAGVSGGDVNVIVVLDGAVATLDGNVLILQ